MSNLPKKFAGRDYEGIVIDLLDDILKAENRAESLIDRIDKISYRPSIRVLDVNDYLRASAVIIILVFLGGVFCGVALQIYISHK